MRPMAMETSDTAEALVGRKAQALWRHLGIISLFLGPDRVQSKPSTERLPLCSLEY